MLRIVTPSRFFLRYAASASSKTRTTSGRFSRMRRAVNARSTFPASSSAARTRIEAEPKGLLVELDGAGAVKGALRHLTARTETLLDGRPQTVGCRAAGRS